MSARDSYPAGQVHLRELGLRDGLQLTKSWPDTKSKLEWINLIHGAGVRHIEVGSFLPSSRFPQFADIRMLIEAVSRLSDLRSAALTLNERAVADALNTDVDEMVIAVSATEEHSLANIGKTRSEAVELVRSASGMRGSGDAKVLVSVAISVAFGCSIAGEVELREVIRLAEQCLEAGADVIGVADTVGFAAPRQVARMCDEILRSIGDVPLIVHLHDTRGTGIANAYAALESGVRILDGTLAGLGGCPFAPGATGNVVFEDLVFLCERCGFPTGIDLQEIVGARRVLERSMPSERLHGSLANAGTPRTIRWRTVRD